MLNNNWIEKTRLVVVCLLLSLTSAAQDNLWTKELKPSQVHSPQTASMIRYDNTASDLNSGRIDLTIPLISFQDPDFDFPMTLSYHSGGFKPSELDNFVGINWSLITGGIISREVKGIPDDAYTEDGEIGFPKVRGFLEPHFLNMTNDQFITKLKSNPEELLWHNVDRASSNIIKENYYSYPVFANTKVEASSDIYHYNFGKHSGDFLINFDKSVSVVARNGGNVKVDLNEYHFDMDNGTNHSILKITTDDGYIYCFGGSYSAMEYTALSWQNEFGQAEIPDPGTGGLPSSEQDTTNKIVAFHLFRIIAPNGRELVINYVDRVAPAHHKDPRSLFYSNYETLMRDRVNECYVLSGDPILLNGPGNIADRSYSLNKVALIESIVTDDKKVQFYYSYPGKKETFSESDVKDFGQSCRTILDSICLFSKTTPDNAKIESCRMKYSVKNNRPYLTELSHSKNGKYAFVYNNSMYLPGPMTINIDHWKYWRGSQAQNRSLIPELKNVGLKHAVEILSDDREPTGHLCDAGLLTQVLFPTGGSTVFEYEPHTYYRVLSKNTEIYTPSLFYAGTKGESKIAGGARIKKISHFDGNNLVKETTYRYCQDRDSEKSSGILMYMPQYGYTRHFKANGSDSNYTTILAYSSNGFNMADYASDHVRYSTVIETNSVLNIDSKPDSTLSASINPLDDLREKRLTFRVGELGEVEKSATCTVKGYGLTNGTAKLTIDDGSPWNIVKEYLFGASTEQQNFVFNLSDLPAGTYQVKMSADPGTHVSIQLDYPNGYTKVVGACKVTKFTDYISNPDGTGIATFFFQSKLMDFVINILDESFLRNFLADPISYAHERGKVREELFYDQSGKLIKKVYNSYGTCNSEYGTYIKQPAMYIGTQFGLYSQIARISLSPCVLKEKRIWEWDGDEMMESVQRNFYDSLGYLKKEETVTSGDDLRVKTYVYASDRKDEPIYEAMQQRNMCGFITNESVYTATTEGSLRDRESISKEFALSGNLHNQNNVPVVSSISCSTNDSPFEVRQECIRYDKYGNLIYKQDDKYLHTVYLWGYSGKYLIAQIENATYEEVKQGLDNYNPEDISSLYRPDMTKVNNLRSKLPEARISTYTYEPLIGMVSMTSPDGEAIYYEYDSAGRLQEEYMLENGEKRIIEHTEYHYVNN